MNSRLPEWEHPAVNKMEPTKTMSSNFFMNLNLIRIASSASMEQIIWEGEGYVLLQPF